MKKIRYICLDDETDTVKPVLARLCSTRADIEIVALPPLAFEEQLARIQKELEIGLDGIILDLRLDRRIPADGQRAVRYTAPGLAAQLRNCQATKSSQAGFPIILWSVQSLLEKSFYPDVTNQDLFDSIYTKQQVAENETQIALELVDFVNGYKYINENQKAKLKVSDLLLVPNGVILDERMNNDLNSGPGKLPAFVYARFIFEQIINQPGPLIGRSVLYSRLGVALDSPEPLERIISKNCVYRGPFGKAWPRWWSSAVDAWWDKTFPKSPMLDRIPAPERAERIRTKFDLANLKAAEVPKGKSPYFSTVCEVTNMPLDPVDGFMIKSKEPMLWQRRRYISRDVAMDPAKYNFRGQLDPMEAARIQQIRSNGKKK
jgi:hypothetical protein